MENLQTGNQGMNVMAMAENFNLQEMVEDSKSGNQQGRSCFSPKQISELQTLLQNLQSTSHQPHQALHQDASQPSINANCNIAQKDSFSTALITKTSVNDLWIIDSGASDHMTGNYELFSDYISCSGSLKIRIADSSLSSIIGIGTIVVSPLITLKSVLHVPNLSCHLISIIKLTKDLSCEVNFSPYMCKFQDLYSGKMIGIAK
ncbi:uncharacterized protein LOC111405878 [Olea europaea var. sylvestris]|uniref:uncharacterized protein LOC111405878 n=1 Tax=Olea europaea var. sylvestris TaxID=158386 RepID=UPI000C1D33BB|nr:uncharacterized protein LOC111405878 [Olea europaea var. sylvestris]